MNANSESSNSQREASPDLAPKSWSWWLRNFCMMGAFFLTGVLLIVAVGFAQRLGWLQTGSSEIAPASQAEEVYTCPMHPQVRQPTPGKCFICDMPLVLLSTGGDEFSITVGPAQRRLANIETAEVLMEPVSRTIRTVGAIQIDESRQAVIAAYIDGRVERLFADYTGVHVEKGDHLAIVYSPQLYAAQAEYVGAKKTFEAMRPQTLETVRQVQETLVGNARLKLTELGMTEQQLVVLEKSKKAESRLTIFAPIGGTVIEKLAEEGKYITAGEPIYRIANLDTVWLMLELYPEDASQIRFGQRVDGVLQSLPGETLTGRVAFIDPTVNAATRTVGVRVEFDNRDKRLRPGDYAQATVEVPIGPTGDVYDEALAGKWISPMHPQIIRDAPGDCPVCGMKLIPTSRYGYTTEPVEQRRALVAPRSAVLLAGRNSVVYVEAEPGRFEIRPVTLGSILGDRVVILKGLKPGEQVATAGNFLIDSQMQLAGKPSLIDPTRAIERQNQRKTPLEFRRVQIVSAAGGAGQRLEELYETYARIQQSLSQDQTPQEEDAVALHRLAEELAAATELGDESLGLLKEIATNSEHLHHLSIKDARLLAFRPISHAIVKLATLVRGDSANAPLYHMFCPMVAGGAGDWLQTSKDLRNPYYGSKMLRCGDVAHAFPNRGIVDFPESKTNAPSSDPAPPREN